MGKVIQTVADSIAIEIVNEDVILTGKGNELHLFLGGHNESKAQEQVLRVRLSNKIHGIHKGKGCNDNTVLVYGEKEFMLLHYVHEDHAFEEFYRSQLSDWICGGIFLNDGQEFILCTAHSVILRFDYNVMQRKCDLRERISCTDKSTLYCVRLCGTKWSDVVVMGGNAFGELLIWQPAKIIAEESLRPKVSELLHRISAHNGVIFSIDYDQESQHLITTSDDRAVKWWRVKFPENDMDNWKLCSFNATASGYGHVARVFKGRIIKNGPQIYALSVGEDSYFCLWRSNGELLFKRRQQYGATIWNFAYDASKQTIYTISSVGNLVCYGLKHILQGDLTKSQEPLYLPSVNGKNPTSSEYIAKIKFLNDQEIVGITNQNRLTWFRNSHASIQKEVTDISYSKLDIGFKSTTLEVCDNRIALCGFKRLLLLQWQKNTRTFETICDEQILDGIIRTFIFFDAYTYMAGDDLGNCQLFSASWKTRYLSLPKSKESWFTTATLLNKDQHILLSNRQGNLLLYHYTLATCSYELISVIKHPHGNLGATSLQAIETNANGSYICSTGHDGAVNIFYVDYCKSELTFCYREIIAVSWVENVLSYANRSNLFLGFNDNHFVVWSKEYDFLLQLPCGGGNRCWHYNINALENVISLAFIKNKRVLYYEVPLYNQEQLSLPPANRWHMAPCNVMHILKDKKDETVVLAVSAGDDNLIKLHTVTKQGLFQKAELHQHISNIRALKIVARDAKESLIFSGGGRAQLCVTKVNNQSFHVQELLSHTLKQTKSDICSPNSGYDCDPETRIMALDVKEMGVDEYCLVIGCSDGWIRCLNIDLATKKVQHSQQYFYNRCVLQVKYLPGLDYVLAAATDGILRIYDKNLEKCLLKLPHHSSGINALATFQDVSKGILKILTGGDDQAVTYTEILLNDFSVIKTFSLPYLHTAQVCASAISSDGRYGYTSGVDQNLYKLELSSGKVVNEFHSCVADIKGVTLLNDDVCLLYGCGMQCYAFN